jgi:hypothetical protein
MNYNATRFRHWPPPNLAKLAMGPTPVDRSRLPLSAPGLAFRGNTPFRCKAPRTLYRPGMPSAVNGADAGTDCFFSCII